MRRTKSASATSDELGVGLSASDFAANREQLEQMSKIADEAAGGAWRPAASTLSRIRAVPTEMVGVDYLTRVGGWPTERFGLIHGPSNEGKTALLLLLGASFLRRMHFFDFIDAEYSTPITYCELMMGREVAHLPTFRAMRPRTYEEVRDAVRRKCDAVGEARIAGRISPQTTGLIGLDSLRKLVPKKLYDTLAKEAADAEESGGRGRGRKSPKGIDGFGGRAAQMKAALNASWLDELVPLLGQTGMAMVVISRETEDPDADVFASDDASVKVGGGKAPFYESSLAMRCLLDGVVYDGADSDKRMVGERIAVRMRKTKLARKFARTPTGFFHVSNGVLVPEGHDKARDVIELGKQLGVVQSSGAWLYGPDGEALGQGINRAVVALTADRGRLERLEAQVRERFELEGVAGAGEMVGALPQEAKKDGKDRGNGRLAPRRADGRPAKVHGCGKGRVGGGAPRGGRKG